MIPKTKGENMNGSGPCVGGSTSTGRHSGPSKKTPPDFVAPASSTRNGSLNAKGIAAGASSNGRSARAFDSASSTRAISGKTSKAAILQKVQKELALLKSQANDNNIKTAADQALPSPTTSGGRGGETAGSQMAKVRNGQRVGGSRFAKAPVWGVPPGLSVEEDDNYDGDDEDDVGEYESLGFGCSTPKCFFGRSVSTSEHKPDAAATASSQPAATSRPSPTGVIARAPTCSNPPAIANADKSREHGVPSSRQSPPAPTNAAPSSAATSETKSGRLHAFFRPRYGGYGYMYMHENEDAVAEEVFQVPGEEASKPEVSQTSVKEASKQLPQDRYTPWIVVEPYPSHLPRTKKANLSSPDSLSVAASTSKDFGDTMSAHGFRRWRDIPKLSPIMSSLSMHSPGDEPSYKPSYHHTGHRRVGLKRNDRSKKGTSTSTSTSTRTEDTVKEKIGKGHLCSCLIMLGRVFLCIAFGVVLTLVLVKSGLFSLPGTTLENNPIPPDSGMTPTSQPTPWILPFSVEERSIDPDEKLIDQQQKTFVPTSTPTKPPSTMLNADRLEVDGSGRTDTAKGDSRLPATQIVSTPGPTPLSTPRPTLPPTPGPTPRPTLPPTPPPTPEPTPPPTPELTPPPTPGPTPRPTSPPTPPPTPVPTPPPTPELTPLPTPGPTPRPTLPPTTPPTPVPTPPPGRGVWRRGGLWGRWWRSDPPTPGPTPPPSPGPTPLSTSSPPISDSPTDSPTETPSDSPTVAPVDSDATDCALVPVEDQYRSHLQNGIDEATLEYLTGLDMFNLSWRMKVELRAKTQQVAEESFGPDNEFSAMVKKAAIQTLFFWTRRPDFFAAKKKRVKVVGTHSSDVDGLAELSLAFVSLHGMTAEEGIEEAKRVIEVIEKRVPGGFDNPIFTMHAFAYDLSAEAGVLMGDGMLDYLQNIPSPTEVPFTVALHSRLASITGAHLIHMDLDMPTFLPSHGRRNVYQELFADVLGAYYMAHPLGGKLTGNEICTSFLAYARSTGVAECDSSLGIDATPSKKLSSSQKACAAIWAVRWAWVDNATAKNGGTGVASLEVFKDRFDARFEGILNVDQVDTCPEISSLECSFY